MKKNLSIYNVLNKYYPWNISNFDPAYDNSPEIIGYKKFLVDLYNNSDNWEKFKQTLGDQGILIKDYTNIPIFNSCYKITLVCATCPTHHYFITYYISAIYPAYCYITLISENNIIIDHQWNKTPKTIVNHEVITDLIYQYFKDYQLLSLDTISQYIPDYAVNNGIGKDKLFSFLFTSDPYNEKRYL